MLTLQQFFYMGGYGYYVWPAYLSVLSTLAVQWFMSWRQWRRYLKQKKL